jgi:D-arabinose 1-dehydrogenase-like Zn-dependent alcohol dehydrogenase
MLASLLDAPAPVRENPLKLTEVAKPVAAGDQVLVRVSVCGVCRTDLHVIEGELPSRKSPIIPGHQVVGHIEAIGPDVTRFRGGERHRFSMHSMRRSLCAPLFYAWFRERTLYRLQAESSIIGFNQQTKA